MLSEADTVSSQESWRVMPRGAKCGLTTHRVGEGVLNSLTRIQVISISETQARTAGPEGSGELAPARTGPQQPSGFSDFALQKLNFRDSPAGQWLRLHAPSTGGSGWIPGQGTGPRVPQLRVCTK